MSEQSETLGQRLKAERERKGLSIQKAADELHLDPWVIDGLESGDYTRVGPAVYAKGHLKRLAQLVGIPPAEVVDGFDMQASPPPPIAQPAAMRMRTSAPRDKKIPWLPITGVAAAALIVAGVAWWRPWHPRTTAPVPGAANANTAGNAQPSVAGEAAGPDAAGSPATGTVAVAGPSAATAGAVGTGALADAAVGGGAAGNGAAANAAAVVTGAAAQPAPDPAAGAGRAKLHFSFSADTWVDVRDASGQRVFAGNVRAKSVRTIAGAAPLRVYLKAPGGVQLEINNHAVAIGRQFIVGDAARFDAGADGVLRRDPHAAVATTAPRPHG